MCGIAGIINFKGNNVSPKTIEYLLSSQTHRGPSASQTYVNKNIAIGCTRLSMCDTNNKNAVFFNEKKDIILVCNGKIYNYSCIKEYLIKKGHTFLTSNDAEIIPHLYEIYGNNFIQYLDGMFVFCLIDLRASLPKIILGRDVFGIKPLYYYQDSSNFIFSSEIKPILSIIPKQHLDKKAVASYLKYRFIANPLTPFKSIKKVKPSTFIIINDQKLRSHKYFPSTKYVSSFKCLSDILENSVKHHLNSDVKLGSFLSGGLDSSIITGLMAKFMPSILSYTIQYKNFSLNETKFANAMSSLHPEIINNYVNVDEKINLSSTINNIVLALEEPLYSTVTVATYLLAQEAKNNISGVLTGDGSDELFMSYQYLKRSYKNTNPLECYKNNIGWLSERMKNFLFYDKKIFNKIKLINKKYDTINTLRKFELSYRLPDYHLLRIDKLTIAHSIEARVPFLCTNLLNYSNILNFKKILIRKNEKTELKNTFHNLLPLEICNRKKQPFSAPYQQWIDNELKKDIKIIFNNKKYCKIFDINQEHLTFLINKNDKKYFDYTAIWGIYILFKWFKAYESYFD